MADKYKIGWPGWELGDRIGKGGFGNVYEIHREGHGIYEKAALKVITIPQSEEEIDYLRGEGMDDESISTQFDCYVNDIIREYKLMIGLKNCPNIVHVDDYLTLRFEDGLGWNIFLKMEILTPMLKAMDQVSTEQQIIKFAMDICNALILCQKKSILHRDIKPQNIFIAEDGCWKLGDFGIARSANRTTRATVGVGTYNFMAPEVLNNKPYGRSADIYSLGLVLYWLLNKRRGPFLPLPPQNYTAVMDEEAKRRRFTGEQIPEPATGSRELRRIVLKACAFEPSQRYTSAQEMYADLKMLQDLSVSEEVTDEEETRKNDSTTHCLEAESERTVRTVSVHEKKKKANHQGKWQKKENPPQYRNVNWVVVGVICLVLLVLAFALGTLVARLTAPNTADQIASGISSSAKGSVETQLTDMSNENQSRETVAPIINGETAPTTAVTEATAPDLYPDLETDEDGFVVINNGSAPDTLCVLGYKVSDGSILKNLTATVSGMSTRIGFSWKENSDAITTLLADYKGKLFTGKDIDAIGRRMVDIWTEDGVMVSAAAEKRVDTSFPVVPSKDCYVLFLSLEKDMNVVKHTIIKVGYPAE